MSSKVLVPAVSLILVVGVALGVVAVVNHSGGSSSSEEKSSAHVKAVAAVCTGATDPKFCQDSLGKAKSDDPKEYVKTVVQSALDNVIKVFNMSDRLSVEHGKSDNGIKMALDDCKDLLQSATHELEASIQMVHEKDLNAIIKENSAELKNWLGAVIAYQQSCMEGFDTDGEKKVQDQLNSGGQLDDVGKITGLALDVVTGVSQLLSSLNLNLNLKPGSRRLLDIDSQGMPTWLSAADRKLLSDLDAAGSPNAVVAKDGSGQFNTIQAALDSYPKNHQGRFVIYVKEGVYDEYITVGKKQTNIFMYGDGMTKTIITGKKSYASGWKTMRTATFSVVGEGFLCKGIAFENTAGAKGHQAVALRVQSDRSAFFECAMHGYQDTLYAHAHRQYYRDCEISGTIDFIFGYSTTLIQNSKIIVRKPESNQQNIVVADGTVEKNMPTGIVLQNCQIVADPELAADKTIRSYLARPWKDYSRAIFMESNIGDFIQPEGWLTWNGDLYLQTCFFAEYANTGPGANTAQRAKWGKGVLSSDDAARYTAGRWLQASTWLPATGVPFTAGFTKA
ncbi:hypothetical protein L6164_034846 [Bauhinia variegata]|uniref:Uncharacterized protein n=1 Tax=Bauhinia variegata TaxID=167791 RepID=A0ACB9KWS6_BAUVA|nr:hypothetical protein L6164_034846 [Bauhinia variegata]